MRYPFILWFSQKAKRDGLIMRNGRKTTTAGEIIKPWQKKVASELVTLPRAPLRPATRIVADVGWIFSAIAFHNVVHHNAAKGMLIIPSKQLHFYFANPPLHQISPSLGIANEKYPRVHISRIPKDDRNVVTDTIQIGFESYKPIARIKDSV